MARPILADPKDNCADVTIFGAGPAGAAMAAALAPFARVVLVERQAGPAPRIGESLIPAARRVLRDMNLLDCIEAGPHAPYLGNRSYWGSPHMHEVDFLRDPNGLGWHLNRHALDQDLRNLAVANGACVFAPAKLQDLESLRDGWRVTLDTGQRITSKLIVDATGRSASVAKRLGATRVNEDNLVALWLRADVTRESQRSAGFSIVESTRDGWWYSAPVPGENDQPTRVLAFHTDKEIAAQIPKDAKALLAKARALPALGPILQETGFYADTLATTAANSAQLDLVHGPGWLAIGDAARSFDPIASRGIFNGFYTAMKAAQACRRVLDGSSENFNVYGADLSQITTAYHQHLRVVYSAEPRWPGSAFWQKRATVVAGYNTLQKA